MIVIERLLAYFIEGFFMIGAGLSMIGIHLEKRHMAWIACIFALIVHGIRTFYIINKIPFGTHTFILLLCFIIVLKYLGKQNIMDSIIAALISFSLLILGDGILLFPLLEFLQLDPITSAGKIGTRLLIIIVSNVFVVLAFSIGYVFKITIIDLRDFHENNL